MNQRSIEFAESALYDLEEIVVWYTTLLVPEIGERFVRELFARTEQLSVFPESGRIVPEFEIKTIRELIHPPFRLVYRIDSTKIWVLRIWRSERLLHLP